MVKGLGGSAKPVPEFSERIVSLCGKDTKANFLLLQFFFFFSSFFPLGKEDFLHQQNVCHDLLIIFYLYLISTCYHSNRRVLFLSKCLSPTVMHLAAP